MLAGEDISATERLVGFDRSPVRPYVDAAVGLGLVRDGDDEQLSDVGHPPKRGDIPYEEW